MTPEQFLKKWIPQAAEWLNVHPESLRMKDDLEAVLENAHINRLRRDFIEAIDGRPIDTNSLGGPSDVLLDREDQRPGLLKTLDKSVLLGDLTDEKEMAHKVFENTLKTEAGALGSECCYPFLIVDYFDKINIDSIPKDRLNEYQKALQDFLKNKPDELLGNSLEDQYTP